MSPWAFFLPHLSQTGYWRSQQPRNTNGYKLKKLLQKPALLSQRIRKGTASQCATFSFRQSPFYSTQTPERKHMPHPNQQRLGGEPRLLPSGGYPILSLQWYQRKPNVKLGHSSIPGSIKSAPHPQWGVSVEITRKPGLILLPGSSKETPPPSLLEWDQRRPSEESELSSPPSYTEALQCQKRPLREPEFSPLYSGNKEPLPHPTCQRRPSWGPGLLMLPVRNEVVPLNPTEAMLEDSTYYRKFK